jgi:hypothetical protein
MKKLLFFFSAIFFYFSISGQKVIDGTYEGLEKICWEISKNGECNNNDNEKPNWKWYHLNRLKIIGDSCFLDQSPVKIYRKDTSFSASDGGFLYFSGRLKRTDSTITLNLQELFCDYTGHFQEKQADGTYKRIKRTKQYVGSLTDSGIVINKFLYEKVDYGEYLISERPPPAYITNNPHYQSVKLIQPKFRNPIKKKKFK